MVVAILVAACSSGAGQVDGMKAPLVSTKPLTVRGSMSRITFGYTESSTLPKGVIGYRVDVVLGDAPDLCAPVGGVRTLKNLTALHLVFRGADTPRPNERYEMGAHSDAPPGHESSIEAALFALDARCRDTLARVHAPGLDTEEVEVGMGADAMYPPMDPAPGGKPRHGWVTFTGIDAAAVTGDYEIQLETGETLRGEFSAPRCDAPMLEEGSSPFLDCR